MEIFEWKRFAKVSLFAGMDKPITDNRHPLRPERAERVQAETAAGGSDALRT